MKTLAILGGTGKEGAGLAMRWALQGYQVVIGSRAESRAKTRAAEMNAELGGDYLGEWPMPRRPRLLTSSC